MTDHRSGTVAQIQVAQVPTIVVGLGREQNINANDVFFAELQIYFFVPEA
jgi:hypothetical protein